MSEARHNNEPIRWQCSGPNFDNVGRKELTSMWVPPVP